MIDVPPVRGDLALAYAQVTGIGGRQSNQDALATFHQDDLACFVISDGAGGHEGGEIASAIVVRAVVDSFQQALSFGGRALRSYVEHAESQVAQAKVGMAHLREMSATVAVVLIDRRNRHALWAHLGDTRIYLFRENRLWQVTKDHSLVQQFIDAGYAKAGATRNHPQRNVLFAAIGATNDVAPEVIPAAIELHAGDAFLICTDGMWEWVTEELMERSLADAASAAAWLADLCREAEKNSAASGKARDNYTAQALWIAECDAGETVGPPGRTGCTGQDGPSND